MGLLTKQIAGAGMSWPDINAKHIYAVPKNKQDEANQWEFALIDVERMEMVASKEKAATDHASSSRQRKLLLTLLRSLSPMPLSREDVERFIEVSSGIVPPAGLVRVLPIPDRGQSAVRDRGCAAAGAGG